MMVVSQVPVLTYFLPPRYLVASRDLKKGELLIEVDALIIGPCAESLPICLGCYVDLIMVPTQY